MEKKLTDEKAMFNYIANTILGEVKPLYLRKRIVNEILDLIHRLQDDYLKLKERYVKVLDLNEKVIADQKAEIERLTKEHERIAWSKQEYLEWVHGFLSTHTDMKDRGEKYEMFDRDWMCNVFWAKIKGSIDYIIDLENQRNELQKQVDEYFKKAYFYYQKCKAYGIEFFYNDEFEAKPAKEGKTIAFPKFKGEEVE